MVVNDAGWFERQARDPLGDRFPWRGPGNGDEQRNRNTTIAERAEKVGRRLLRALPIRLVLRILRGRP